MPGSARLGVDERTAAFERLDSQHYDVLVVGGGVTGAGVALDAVTRGLRVALVEARDFASGTSSRSSKLFHGGLRYLEQMNFGLVREALRERELMLTRIAPHLVKPVAFMYPLNHRVWERPYVGSGLLLYDTMGGGRSVPRHRHLTRTGARKLAPALKPSSLTGALQYYDAQTDDARHTLTVARTAAAYGADVLNSAEVVEVLHAGERVVGARVRDVETGAEKEVRSSVVVNATGVWTDAVQTLAGGRGRFHVRASKGVHIVVPRDRINSETGLILRTEKSVLFVIPWTTHWIIGTTDTDWNLDLAHPAASRADLDYLLDHVNRVLSVPLTHDDIQGVYAGLRPLLAGESEQTSQLSREHAVARPQPGLVAVAGGKYTSLAEAHGLPAWQIERLLNRYGSMTGEVLALAAEDRSLLRMPSRDAEYLGVEFAYAAGCEGALHLDDLLARRTRMSIETPDRGVAVARAVAEVVAPRLGWDAERVDSEVAAYEARVEAERESQRKSDDLAADAARVAAPDTRRLAVGRALH